MNRRKDPWAVEEEEVLPYDPTVDLWNNVKLGDLSELNEREYDYTPEETSALSIQTAMDLGKQALAGSVDLPLGYSATADAIAQLIGINPKSPKSGITLELEDLQKKLQGAPDNLDELLEKEGKGQLNLDETRALDAYLPKELRAEFGSKDVTDKIHALFSPLSGGNSEVSFDEAFRWFTLNSVRMIPTTLAMLSGGGMVAPLVRRGIAMVSLTGGKRLAATQAGAIATTGAMSAFLEAGLEYKGLLDEGVNPEDAAIRALVVGAGAGVITMGTVGVSAFRLAGKQGLKWMATRFVTGEPLEEGLQKSWGNVVNGRPMSQGVGEASFLSLGLGFFGLKAGNYTFKQMQQEMNNIDALQAEAIGTKEELESQGFITGGEFLSKLSEANDRVGVLSRDQKAYMEFTVDQIMNNPNVELSEDQKEMFGDLALVRLAQKFDEEGAFGKVKGSKGIEGKTGRLNIPEDTLQFLDILARKVQSFDGTGLPDDANTAPLEPLTGYNARPAPSPEGGAADLEGNVDAAGNVTGFSKPAPASPPKAEGATREDAPIAKSKEEMWNAYEKHEGLEIVDDLTGTRFRIGKKRTSPRTGVESFSVETIDEEDGTVIGAEEISKKPDGSFYLSKLAHLPFTMSTALDGKTQERISSVNYVDRSVKPKAEGPAEAPTDTEKGDGISGTDIVSTVKGYIKHPTNNKLELSSSKLKADLHKVLGRNYDKILAKASQARSLGAAESFKKRVEDLRNFEDGAEKLSSMLGEAGTNDLNALGQHELRSVARDMGIAKRNISAKTKKMSTEGMFEMQRRLSNLSEQGYPQVTIEGFSDAEDYKAQKTAEADAAAEAILGAKAAKKATTAAKKPAPKKGKTVAVNLEDGPDEATGSLDLEDGPDGATTQDLEDGPSVEAEYQPPNAEFLGGSLEDGPDAEVGAPETTVAEEVARVKKMSMGEVVREYQQASGDLKSGTSPKSAREFLISKLNQGDFKLSETEQETPSTQEALEDGPPVEQKTTSQPRKKVTAKQIAVSKKIIDGLSNAVAVKAYSGYSPSSGLIRPKFARTGLLNAIRSSKILVSEEGVVTKLEGEVAPYVQPAGKPLTRAQKLKAVRLGKRSPEIRKMLLELTPEKLGGMNERQQRDFALAIGQPLTSIGKGAGRRLSIEQVQKNIERAVERERSAKEGDEGLVYDDTAEDINFFDPANTRAEEGDPEFLGGARSQENLEDGPPQQSPPPEGAIISEEYSDEDFTPNFDEESFIIDGEDVRQQEAPRTPSTPPPIEEVRAANAEDLKTDSDRPLENVPLGKITEKNKQIDAETKEFIQKYEAGTLTDADISQMELNDQHLSMLTNEVYRRYMDTPEDHPSFPVINEALQEVVNMAQSTVSLAGAKVAQKVPIERIIQRGETERNINNFLFNSLADAQNIVAADKNPITKDSFEELRKWTTTLQVGEDYWGTLQQNKSNRLSAAGRGNFLIDVIGEIQQAINDANVNGYTIDKRSLGYANSAIELLTSRIPKAYGKKVTPEIYDDVATISRRQQEERDTAPNIQGVSATFQDIVFDQAKTLEQMQGTLEKFGIKPTTVKSKKNARLIGNSIAMTVDTLDNYAEGARDQGVSLGDYIEELYGGDLSLIESEKNLARGRFVPIEGNPKWKKELEDWHGNSRKVIVDEVAASKTSGTVVAGSYSLSFREWKNDKELGERMEVTAQGFQRHIKGMSNVGIDIHVYTRKERQPDGTTKEIILGFRTEGSEAITTNDTIEQKTGNDESDMVFGSKTATAVHVQNDINRTWDFSGYVGSMFHEMINDKSGWMLRADHSYATLEMTRKLVDEQWAEIEDALEGRTEFPALYRGESNSEEDRTRMPEERQAGWKQLNDIGQKAGIIDTDITDFGENLATRVIAQVRDGKPIKLIGQKGRNATEIGVAVQVLRNPHVEVSTLVFVKDGKIFDNWSVTNFDPRAVMPPHLGATPEVELNARAGLDFGGDLGNAQLMAAHTKGLKVVKEFIEENGITEIYTSHNHPNAATLGSSEQDRDSFQQNVNNYGDIWKGEIITDGGKVLFADNTFAERIIEFKDSDFSGSTVAESSGALMTKNDEMFSSPLLTTSLEISARAKASPLILGKPNQTKAEMKAITGLISATRRSVLRTALSRGDTEIHPKDRAKFILSSDANRQQGGSVKFFDIAEETAYEMLKLRGNRNDMVLVSATNQGQITNIRKVPFEHLTAKSYSELEKSIRSVAALTGGANLMAYVYGKEGSVAHIQKRIKDLQDRGLIDHAMYIDEDTLPPEYRSAGRHFKAEIFDVQANKARVEGRSRNSVTSGETFARYSTDEPTGSIANAPMSEEAKRRMDDAYDPLSDYNWKEKLKNTAEAIKEGFTQTYKGLPRMSDPKVWGTTGFFSVANNALKEAVGARDIATFQMTKDLGKLTEGMTPEQTKDFSLHMVFRDLKAQDSKDALAYIEEDGTFRTNFGLTKSEIDKSHKYYSDIVKADPKLLETVKNRDKLIAGIRDRFASSWKALGIPIDSRFNEEDYFRHQVIEYSRDRAEAKHAGKLMVPSKMEIMRKRMGGNKDYVTNYMLAEGEVIQSLVMGERVAKALGRIKKEYNDPLVKQLKADHGKNWHSFIPETHTIYHPEKGKFVYFANTVTDNNLIAALDKQMRGMFPDLDEVTRQQMMMGGNMPGFVVPNEVNWALLELENRTPINAFSAYGSVVRFMKQNLLINPFRITKYNLRNISGDAEAVFLGNRRLFTSAEGRANIRKSFYAMKTVYLDKDSNFSDEVTGYMMQGGFSATDLTVDLATPTNLTEELNRLGGLTKDKKKTPFAFVRSYFKGAQKYSDFREQILRYANYLDFKQQIEENGNPLSYGASDPASVNALETTEMKAFKLSNDLLGAYDEVSVLGQDIRRKIAWFWSWQETNARRYKQLFVNDLNPNGEKQMLFGDFARNAVKSPTMYMLGAKFTMKALALQTALQLYNHIMWPDEEADLEEHVQSKPHIILGKVNGKTIHFQRLGATSDILEWAGLDDFTKDWADVWNGKRTIPQVAGDNTLEGMNKAVQTLRPDIKIFVELVFGMSSFPNIFKPMTIRDRSIHASRAFGLEPVYKAITEYTPDGVAPFGLLDRRSTQEATTLEGYLEKVAKEVAYLADPPEVSYHKTFQNAKDFEEKRGKGGSSSSWSDATNALYNMKRGIKHGDQEAVEFYMMKYLFHDGDILRGSLSGLKSSVERMAPLATMSTDNRREFIRSMTPAQKADYERAKIHYRDTILGAGTIEEIIAQTAHLYADKLPVDDLRQTAQQMLSDALVDVNFGDREGAQRKTRAMSDFMSRLSASKRAEVTSKLNISGIRGGAKRKTRKKALERAIESAPSAEVAHAIEAMFGI